MRISLITACYNNVGVLTDNLISVRNQYRRQSAEQGSNRFQLEHLFQDGGSTDGSLDLLEDYKISVEYPVLIFSGQDEGFYDAINRGIQRSTGDIMGLLNADDWFSSDDVLQAITKEFANNPDLDILYADMDFVTQASNLKEFKVTREWRSGNFSKNRMRYGWIPPHPTIYVRRRVIERAGIYRLDMGSSADFEWMLRILFMNDFKISYIPKVLVNMRLGGQSTASLRNRLLANNNDRKAWELNGLKPAPGFRLIKPLRKLLQWI